MQANRLQDNHGLMDAGRRSETPGSETKDVITPDKSHGGNAEGHRRIQQAGVTEPKFL